MKKERAKEKFREYLKTGKHRITPERFEVLYAALDYKGHFGADDLYVKMKTEKSRVSRATVYNTLELLDKSGIIAKRNFGDGKTHYEGSFEKNNHDHLICTNCGRIIEFEHPGIDKIIAEVAESNGLKFTGYSFTIFGLCGKSKCRGKDKK